MAHMSLVEKIKHILYVTYYAHFFICVEQMIYTLHKFYTYNKIHRVLIICIFEIYTNMLCLIVRFVYNVHIYVLYTKKKRRYKALIYSF